MVKKSENTAAPTGGWGPDGGSPKPSTPYEVPEGHEAVKDAEGATIGVKVPVQTDLEDFTKGENDETITEATESAQDASDDVSGTAPADESEQADTGTDETAKTSSPRSNTGRDQLIAFAERIERLEEEKKAIGEDIKEVYAEVKGNGFDPKILRKVLRLRKMDVNARLEEESLVDVYMHALGMTVADD